MKILIFGGTSESHRLSDELCELNTEHTICVATDYGEKILKEDPYRNILTGRLDGEGIKELIETGGYELVIDATHPYATAVTDNIISAVKETKAKLIRLRRDSDADIIHADNEYVVTYSDKDKLGKSLKETKGNILFTTGSKDLKTYTGIMGEDELDRLYARVIPGKENLTLCEEAGISMSHVIAMQGPFNVEMNEAIIKQYGISHLVTKESGSAGGFYEKMEAVKRCGIKIHILTRPGENPDIVCKSYEEILKLITGKETETEISLIGTGMGDILDLTIEAYKAICEADVILGAQRLVSQCREWMDKPCPADMSIVKRHSKIYEPIYTPDAIVRYLTEHDGFKGKSVAVLFSGDTGFNSGCAGVYDALKKLKISGSKTRINILPGISSVSYMSKMIGRPYDKAAICSMHGKDKDSVYIAASYVRYNRDTFVLTGGRDDILRLTEVLDSAGMEDCTLTVGRNLSHADEALLGNAVKDIRPDDIPADGLMICHIRNPKPVIRPVAPGLRPEEMIRGNVPMTKEEVRTIVMDKLKLRPDSRLMDIGCGTGSISVEAAGLMPEGIVYAYDKNDEAVSLTTANKKHHRLPNIVVVKGTAPEVLGKDFSATHAFIGGNDGRLKDILDALKARGTHIRVVANAITDKTKDVLKEWMADESITDASVVRVQIGRSGTDADADEMTLENPVYIYSFEIN